MKERILVTGAGGFIGHHMVKYLKEKGYYVRGADIKKPEYEKTHADEFLLLDLREKTNADIATQGINHVYNFAANMGGIGFIETVHAEVMHDNVLINTHMLDRAYRNGVKRYFYSSSACIYPRYKQQETINMGLRESDAYPADPDNEYGWEKLYTERLCQAYYQDHKFETRIARFHNIYGPLGSWQGGREKSPAAMCRKIAMAKKNDTIEVWGDGEQGRSYCFVRDCIEGVYRLMMSDIRVPINIGSDRLVTINQLIDIISKFENKTIHRKYDKTKPQGVRGRNSDNTLINELLQWEPSITLEEGLKETYYWIKSEIEKNNYLEAEHQNSTEPVAARCSNL
ncbi:NAD-dependent epimerase/dehydratase family protein [Candidatus Roizmanbacteria bacterium]|nr:NAD-dependent epimerase/dehydratase family protein [Candidatus Roizmanbacteria bacterium]